MSEEYTGSGGFDLGGCAPFAIHQTYEFDFAQGSIVYVRRKARRGILEKVSIKRLVVNGQGGNVYVDTFNEVWLEEELCSESLAVEIATASIEATLAQFNTIALKCSYRP